MSLNLRGCDDPPPNDWAHRRPRLARLLECTAPDVLGTQEALAAVLDEVCADAEPGLRLAWNGVDRRGGRDDEHCAVVHREDRWRVVASGDLALSDLPEALGTKATSTQGFPRMVTWVRLAPRCEGGEILVVNTHLDHLCARSRVLAAEQLVSLVDDLAPDGPVVVTGDFNAQPGSDPHRILLTRLDPVFPRTGAPDTFHGHGAGRGCLDWVLGRGVEVLRAGVAAVDRPVSDHHPVLARLCIAG